MRPFGLALMIGLVLGASLPARAASFDCAKARGADERAICRHPRLNDQDVRLGEVYSIASRFLGMGARDALREQQAAWLRARKRCGDNVPCLRRAYDRRLGELRGVLEKAYQLGPI
jgi:uncharacterized protein